jgi:hypothetical protein
MSVPLGTYPQQQQQPGKQTGDGPAEPIPVPPPANVPIQRTPKLPVPS